MSKIFFGAEGFRGRTVCLITATLNMQVLYITGQDCTCVSVIVDNKIKKYVTLFLKDKR
jgi:hypothetical protein